MSRYPTPYSDPPPPPKGLYEKAACVGMDPTIFVAIDDGPEPTKVPKVCDRCEVRVECVDYAVRWRMPGIWGSTDAERLKLRRLAKYRRKPA